MYGQTSIQGLAQGIQNKNATKTNYQSMINQSKDNTQFSMRRVVENITDTKIPWGQIFEQQDQFEKEDRNVLCYRDILQKAIGGWLLKNGWKLNSKNLEAQQRLNDGERAKQSQIQIKHRASKSLDQGHSILKQKVCGLPQRPISTAEK